MPSKYLSDEILSGFDGYKYSSMDTSPFSNYVMHPFWNWFVKLIPAWVPANSLTFVGFLLLPLNFIVLTYYDSDFTQNFSIPLWVWLMCAINNFLSHTLDGVDGKQARKTKTSSALGELFDHGLDAWSTSFFAIAIYDIFGQGYWGAPPFRFYLVLMALQCTFCFSHWEKYNTGVLYLPWGYDPALTAMTILYLITYLFSVNVWQFHVYNKGGFSITFCDFLEGFLYVSNYLVSVPVCVYNVCLSYKEKTGRMLSAYESLRPLIPAALLFSLTTVWAIYSKTSVLENNPRCFFMLSGIVFANITSKMIMNQMSHTRALAFNNQLIPLCIITPLCTLYNIGIYETYLLYGYTASTLLFHIRYGVLVVHDLAEHLNIYVFSVEKKPTKSKAD